MHGGKSLPGVLNPSFKTGKYAKDLPTRLAARAEQAAADPKIFELRGEIGVVESRIADLLSRVDSGESGKAWQLAESALTEFHRANQAKDTSKQVEALNRLRRIIQTGLGDYAAWAAVGQELDRKQRLVESERKYLVEQKLTMTVEQSMLLATAMATAAIETITDKEMLGAFYARLRELLSVSGVPIDVTPSAGDIGTTTTEPYPRLP